MNRDTFNKMWRFFHLLCIGVLLSYTGMKTISAFNHPVDIHLPTSEEIRERTEFDLSGPQEIELENGDVVVVYEA